MGEERPGGEWRGGVSSLPLSSGAAPARGAPWSRSARSVASPTGGMGDPEPGAAPAGTGDAPPAPLPPPSPSAAAPAHDSGTPDPAGEDEDALLAAFMDDVKHADRDAEVHRVLGAFKLNPYEQLGARFDADDAALARAFRKSSLLVHPDKCSHPRAADAFDMLAAAMREIREGERGHEVRHVIGLARERVVADRAKTAKTDGVARLAAALHGGGATGAAAAAAAWEASDAFHAAWRDAARELLARAEFKRRKLTLRLKETEARLEEEEDAARKKAKHDAKADRAWEKGRGARVGNWRDFQKKKGAAGVRAPTSTAVDAARSYVRRPDAAVAAAQAKPPPPAPPRQR